jgi:hypothetical protein
MECSSDCCRIGFFSERYESKLNSRSTGTSEDESSEIAASIALRSPPAVAARPLVDAPIR